MGRPLKIAKAQAVITITSIDGTTEVVTTSNNFTTLGIIADMPFIVATTTGGLTAGTTYWILEVINSGNNSTFTVSATPLDANPTYTKVNLTTAGPVTVSTTVGLVDYGFNNPDGSNTATNGTSYGVVGGNTALYGKQILANVCIGQSGTGTVFASTSSNNVVGYGTDFANVATGSKLYSILNNDVTTPILLGTTTATKGNLTVVVANTTATGNVIGTSGNAQTLTLNTPVTFNASFGNLTAGVTYWVKTIANAAAFTVSAVPAGAPVALTSNASVTGNAIQNRIVLAANSANNATGVDGTGDTFVQALPEAGFILRQKGKTKYLVQGTTTGLVAQCYTANVANASLSPNTMSIIATYANASTAYVQAVNDYQTQVFPTTVADGSLTPGAVYVIYSSGNTNWTAVGAASNITGVTFTATGAGGSGTGLATLSTANPDVIATFGTAYAANTYGGQITPIVTIANS